MDLGTRWEAQHCCDVEYAELEEDLAEPGDQLVKKGINPCRVRISAVISFGLDSAHLL
jgi:hypothetical protein